MTRDGEAAAEFLYQRSTYADAPRPDRNLLDLNLPNKDGEEFLAETKADSDSRRIPVIIPSSSAADEDTSTASDRCANAYLVKPVGKYTVGTVIRPGVAVRWRRGST
ncbi:response regulator [Natronococcus wangiae]|uniref:response regulator n=1 Tax=Natronococcus wangiae TaxID=3068275 RepID=UPI00387E4E7A